MANISCNCGHVFSDGQIPCPYEYNLIPDGKGEELTEKILEIAKNDEDVWVRVEHLILTLGVTVYQCPSCKGLLVFWQGTHMPAEYYIRSV